MTTTKPHEYEFIRLWGQMMGSQLYYIEDQQAKAAMDEAPITAIYERTGVAGAPTHQWAVAEDVQAKNTREALKKLAEFNGFKIPFDVLKAWEDNPSAF